MRVSYGAAPAISGVSIRVGTGELVCVVGPNGAGKTTLINAIAGLRSIEAGALRLDGRDLSRLPRHAFCGEGIAIVPEGRRLFAGMSVRENLELGSYRRGARPRRARAPAPARAGRSLPPPPRPPAAGAPPPRPPPTLPTRPAPM